MGIVGTAKGHELRPGYLEFRQADTDTFDAFWKVPARGELRLGLYVRLPEGCTEVGQRLVYPTARAKPIDSTHRGRGLMWMRPLALCRSPLAKSGQRSVVSFPVIYKSFGQRPSEILRLEGRITNVQLVGPAGLETPDNAESD